MGVSVIHEGWNKTRELSETNHEKATQKSCFLSVVYKVCLWISHKHFHRFLENRIQGRKIIFYFARSPLHSPAILSRNFLWKRKTKIQIFEKEKANPNTWIFFQCDGAMVSISRCSEPYFTGSQEVQLQRLRVLCLWYQNLQEAHPSSASRGEFCLLILLRFWYSRMFRNIL